MKPHGIDSSKHFTHTKTVSLGSNVNFPVGWPPSGHRRTIQESESCPLIKLHPPFHVSMAAQVFVNVSASYRSLCTSHRRLSVHCTASQTHPSANSWGGKQVQPETNAVPKTLRSDLYVMVCVTLIFQQVP